MKSNQRKIFNRLKKALADGRNLGYKPTTSKIYYPPMPGYDWVKEETVEPDYPGFACAFGAMAAGLGADIDTLRYTQSTITFVAKALGVDTGCVDSIYGPIYMGNDRTVGGGGDKVALEYLEGYLNTHPEVC